MSPQNSTSFVSVLHIYYRLSHIFFIVEWKQIDYNIGNHFDGTIFAAPTTGLYTFHATSEQFNNTGDASIFVHVNGRPKLQSRNYTKSNDFGFVTIQTTLKIAEDDKVEVRFNGKLSDANNTMKTHFEGRLISELNE